ncbi:diguanylate cyclase domain protein [Lyngbya aestuarii BL J]|uniref:Diguanylate cyclase domain protein n=1 Tax=Lyngbya aestuarii BL J TaxID=1348334 RepID=U7QME4_9CYAN|nr:diguanylate cyclase domain protein [Lyngbya aestuarii BL J]
MLWILRTRVGKLQKYKQKLASLTGWFSQNRRVILTSSSIAGIVIAMRALGFLQPLEWSVLDLFFRWRPLEPIDERILIVGIDESDLQAYGFPIPDNKLAQLLQQINAAEPQAIGLDLYRDLPTEPGYAELVQAFQTIPNIVGIETFESGNGSAVNPPPILAQKDQVGFNNFMTDTDGVVRRGLLHVWFPDDVILESFPLKLATIYLENQGVSLPSLAPATDFPLGEGNITRFRQNDGAYVRADAGGYQFLANLRGPMGRFRRVSMTEVLEGRVPSELIRDRIVLIGPTAPSVKDTHFTSYSGGLFQSREKMYGVELMANFVSQILSTALDNRTQIQVWSDPVEWLWILGWSWVGASLCWKLRAPYRSTTLVLLLSVGLSGGAYLLFCYGWWIPVVPPLITLLASAAVVVGYLAHLQGEFKRSTDFLSSVINTIPDPIYVKNKNHHKIVINQAYCKLVGYPMQTLMSKSDYELFPQQEADIFWKQDELAFYLAGEQENEEKLTDAQGITRFIATKRSIHRDAAGNIFLVGVIRDITERKCLEEELKRIAAELEHYNAQLKVHAEQDPLTGLANRKVFNERLAQSLEWATNNNKLVALFYLDLNDFKIINDTMGHHIGDLLLKTVAQRLNDCLRSSDTVARLGGDEFTVILPGIPRKADVARVAKKILQTITQEAHLDGHIVSVTTSIGISVYPLDAHDLNLLTQKADDAMYRAKRSGKNRYKFATSSPEFNVQSSPED